MAKEIKKYICEICGVVYDKQDDAIKCEKEHKKIKSIGRALYESKTCSLETLKEEDKYPKAVLISFDDGTEKLYERSNR